MRPPESSRLGSVHNDADSPSIYRIQPAILLKEWTVEETGPQNQPYCFSPSGRLLIETDADSYRISDLFTGNNISVDCPELRQKFHYLPLTEFGGILYDGSQFMRAELDLENRRLVADWETVETVPEDCFGHCCGSLFTRLNADTFAFIAEVDIATFMIHIRRLDAKTDEEKWIEIENGGFEGFVWSMRLHGNELYVFTSEYEHLLMRYSLAEKRWTTMQISGLGRSGCSEIAAKLFNGLLIAPRIVWKPCCLGFQTMHNSPEPIPSFWEFVVVDPKPRECYQLRVDYPAPLQWPKVTGKMTVTEFGILGVLVYYDPVHMATTYQTHMINLRKPLSLGLSAHFSLLRTAKRFDNLPALDPIPPIFGHNPYRYNKEVEKKETERRKAIQQKRKEREAEKLEKGRIQREEEEKRKNRPILKARRRLDLASGSEAAPTFRLGCMDTQGSTGIFPGTMMTDAQSEAETSTGKTFNLGSINGLNFWKSADSGNRPILKGMRRLKMDATEESPTEETSTPQLDLNFWFKNQNNK